MANVVIELNGYDEILKKIDSVQKLERLGYAMLSIASHVKGKVDRYPPATAANTPRNYTTGGRNTWYERGYGPKWARKDGSVGGRKTSEMLGRSWSVAMRDNGLTMVIGTKASYAPYVHDRDKQASFHKAHGWKTVQDIAKEEEATVMKFLQDYMKRELGLS